jgi:hypothetical protein
LLDRQDKTPQFAVWWYNLNIESIRHGSVPQQL